MSLVKKIKDILFEEEEVTEAITPIKEEVREVKRPEVERERVIERPERPERIEETPKQETQSERDLFKTDNSFRFPDFDEEEFKSSMPQRQSTNNVLEYERKKTTEKRTDFGRYEKIETREVIEKKKFKPSPIISPVYGVLHQDYTPDDVKNKGEDLNNTLNLDEVRKRAFEPEEIIVENEDVIDEPVVTFFEEKETITINGKPQEEMRSIDELLESASEDAIELEDELELPGDTNIDVIEEELESYSKPDAKEKISKVEENLEDTLESDLFELIDSMYDTREDGE